MRKVTLLLTTMAMAALLVPPPAWADTTFTVDSTTDVPDANPGDGACSTAADECTLRAAIQEANALGGDDVVGFDPSVGGTITLGGTNLLISSNLKIEGPGADELSVDANSQSRIFDVQSGTVEISGLTISGGKVDDGDDSVCSDRENGGGIYNIGNLTLSDSTVSRNAAACAGGGIFNGIYNGGNLTVSNSTISDNATTGGSGGGIYDEGVTVTLSDTTVTGNTARGSGGGVHSYATLTLSDTTISDNTAEYDGGGISTFNFSRQGSLSVESSTISGNAATRNGGGINSLSPSVGGDSSASKTTVANSTISANTAKEGYGGGLHNENGLMEIGHSTITDNTAPAGQGDGVASYGDAFTSTEVYSSIISANTHTDDTGTDTGTDVDFVLGSWDDSTPQNSFVSEGHNLVGDGNATSAFDAQGDRTGVSDPGLGALADNGGPTETRALLSGSPARDAGDPAFAPPPQFDQRGEGHPRLRGARVDIGAFEADPPSSDLSVTKGGPANVKPGRTIEYTISVANAGPDAADDVTLADTLPGTTTFVSLTQESGTTFNCTTPAVGAGGTVSCSSASLASGASGTFALVVRVPEGTASGTEFTNTAQVESQASDPAPPNNSSSATTTVVDPEPGTLGFDQAAYSVDEDAGTAAITVVREGGSDGGVSVDYSTQDGTATSGSDYTATTGTLEFAEGQTSRTFVVPVTDDALDEREETVNLALSGPQGGAVIGAQADATLTVADDDEPPPGKPACTVRGNDRNNVLRGTDNRDVICGLGGNDTIRGLGGDDLVMGGTGDDDIIGGEGDDILKGQLHYDTLLGGAGDDELYGGDGRDVLRGGPGTDITRQ